MSSSRSAYVCSSPHEVNAVEPIKDSLGTHDIKLCSTGSLFILIFVSGLSKSFSCSLTGFLRQINSPDYIPAAIDTRQRLVLACV